MSRKLPILAVLLHLRFLPNNLTCEPLRMKRPTYREWDRNDPDSVHALVKRTGLTQGEAAQEIGLAPRTLRMYLNGRRKCPYHVAARLWLLK